ncbi:hypothetical protein Z043_111538 [Scleropages formosus]|uniref:Uncharacterized protein n=1 Tax=Scleropages formosus TaxID=113540 RepID=A0A0P7X686_SCLFO|nr:hypothetical protein Z043_111538 [Scleropages formosus]
MNVDVTRCNLSLPSAQVGLWKEAGMGCCASQGQEDVDPKHRASENGCTNCCRSTRGCLMSPECGRALQIASTCAMCGMCLEWFANCFV